MAKLPFTAPLPQWSYSRHCAQCTSKRKPYEKTDEQKTNKKTCFQHFMLNIFSHRVILNYTNVSLLANHDIFVKDIPLLYLGKSTEKLYLTLFIMAFKIYFPFLNGLNPRANYS